MHSKNKCSQHITKQTKQKMEKKPPLAIVKNPRENRVHRNKWKLITPYDMYASIVGVMGDTSTRGTNIFQDIIPDIRTCSESGIPNE